MAKHTQKSHTPAKPAPKSAELKKRKFYDEEDEEELETTEPKQPPAAKEDPWEAKPEPPVPAPPPTNVVRRSVDEELATPTPREVELAELAKANAQVGPQRYDITSKNPHALRVIHDHSGRPIEIQPGQTRSGVWLQPQTADLLKHTDLEVKPSA
jgi:hypothetical protein